MIVHESSFWHLSHILTRAAACEISAPHNRQKCNQFARFEGCEEPMRIRRFRYLTRHPSRSVVQRFSIAIPRYYLTSPQKVKYCLHCSMNSRKVNPIREWTLRNRGIQIAIAKHFGFSREHIRGVLQQKHYSRNGQIESVLADLGAPGMRERQKEAQIRSRGRAWTEREKKRLMAQLRKIQAGRRAA